MRGDRTNYGKGDTVRVITLRLSLEEQIKLARLAKKGETTQDTIKRVIAQFC